MILDILKKITQNQLFKVTSLSSFSILVRLITGFLSSKVIAYFVGPSGMALMGNLRSFTSLLESVGTLGIQNGVLQNVAKNQKDEVKLNHFVRLVFWTLLVFSLIISTTLLFGNSYFGKMIFNKQSEYYFILNFVAFFLPFQVLHLFFTTVLNGFSAYKKVKLISIFGYIASLLVSFIFIWFYGVYGALISVSITSFLLFLFSSFHFFKAFSFGTIFRSIKIDFSVLKGLIPFGIMSLFTAVLTPILYIFIRNLITKEVSIEASGWFEAMQRISGFYFMFISTLVSFYFLPELIKTNTDSEKVAITTKFYKQVIPVFTLVLIGIYFTKDFVIQLLLTSDFYQVRELFVWQLVGDFFKAMSLILGIRFYVIKDLKGYLLTESISFLVFFVASWFWIPIYGAIGAVISYAATYVVYFLALVVYFRKVIFKA